MNYIFLRETNLSGNETDRILAVDSTKIQTLNVFETYDFFGQQVGHEAAGDTHPENPYSDELRDKYKEMYPTEQPEELEAFCEEFADQIWIAQCQGLNFWNGNNWQTIITEAGDWGGFPPYTVIEDAKEIAALIAAIKTKEFLKEGFGYKLYESESGDYIITDSQFAASSWYEYEIETREDYAYKTGQK